MECHAHNRVNIQASRHFYLQTHCLSLVFLYTRMTVFMLNFKVSNCRQGSVFGAFRVFKSISAVNTGIIKLWEMYWHVYTSSEGDKNKQFSFSVTVNHTLACQLCGEKVTNQKNWKKHFPFEPEIIIIFISVLFSILACFSFHEPAPLFPLPSCLWATSILPLKFNLDGWQWITIAEICVSGSRQVFMRIARVLEQSRFVHYYLPTSFVSSSSPAPL